jgi:choice-of-anchor A domain-containing protein
MKLRLVAAVAAASLSVFAAGSASAGVTEVNAALDAMSYYNVIVRGDYKNTSEVQGRSFIGGNLNGNAGQYNFGGLSGTGLTVVGDVNLQGGGKANTRGDIKVGGSIITGIEFQNSPQHIEVGGTVSNTNNANANGNTVTQNAGLKATLEGQRDTLFGNPANSADKGQFGELTTYLKNLTPTHSIDPANVKFDVGTGTGVAVYSIANLATALASVTNLQFDMPTTYDLVVINVAGTDITLPGGYNFNGPSGLGTKVIWNFYEATNLDFGSKAWYGSVLAPLATAKINNFIEGSAVFATLQGDGELHTPGFRGYDFPDLPPPTEIPGVPEPATWAMMILGFGAAGTLLRRRRMALAA